MELRQNISLTAYNTFGVEASTHFFVRIASTEDAKEMVASGTLAQRPYVVLGGGSNILFTKDFEGLVIKNEIEGIELIREEHDWVYVRAGGGENWHRFVLYCVEKGWQGIENLSLIPGTVGAAPIQNIGAYGVELKDVFDHLEALDLSTGELHTFHKEQCEFGYRDSIFKRTFKGKYLVTSVALRLRKKPQLNTSYGAIEKTLQEKGIRNPTLRDVSNAVIAIRQSKLPDPKEIGNCGSFFKNPIIPKEALLPIQQLFPNIPYYPVEDGQVKVPAGWLIEQCGWKGKKVGKVGTYAQQALVLVNLGGAKGEEAWQLAQKIQKSVQDKFGILIEPEVNIL
ncbi:UDP-N-acetylmuramate dehydrogenase [Rapidithrix thailandica]|uniref:UDP-N-acetylenolpyruvoylglucosamine reductase n=1 Tax=Rapidithrix thailandica TaxID=413964 RepID=A0AAW9SBD4_9BACT